MPEVTRDFAHSIYYPSALHETAEAYAELVEVQLEPQDDTTCATFSEEGMIVDAFCNHALFLSIQAYRDSEEAS